MARLDVKSTVPEEASTKVDSRGKAGGTQHVRRAYVTITRYGMRRREHNVRRAVGDADKMRRERGEADPGRRAGGEASMTKDVARVGSADATRGSNDLGLSNLKHILVSNSTGPSCGSP